MYDTNLLYCVIAYLETLKSKYYFHFYVFCVEINSLQNWPLFFLFKLISDVIGFFKILFILRANLVPRVLYGGFYQVFILYLDFYYIDLNFKTVLKSEN